MIKTITPTDLFELKDKCNDTPIQVASTEAKGPKQKTINRILNYSKALCIKKSATIKQIELILN